MKASIRGLAADKEEGEKFAQSFVFLNVYCKSVKDEHGVRGPEGPYRFEGDGAPMIVIKKWDGEEFTANVGWVADAKDGKGRLQGLVKSALEKNGEVKQVDRQEVAKLLPTYDAAIELIEEKPGKAYEEFAEIVEEGADEDDWPNGPTHIHEAAQKRMDTIIEGVQDAIDAALALEKDSKKKSTLRKLKKAYKGADAAIAKIEEAEASLE